MDRFNKGSQHLGFFISRYPNLQKEKNKDIQNESKIRI
ncbi:hypothetical protein ND00_14460 [Clostridium sp. L74]|nr:hypothetical protein ND00_14460 [Clostridium sp. L74]